MGGIIRHGSGADDSRSTPRLLPRRRPALDDRKQGERMSTLNRIASLRTLQQEWESMPEGKPEQRERWFEMVGTEIAALPSDAERTRWILLLAQTLHHKQRGLPMSVCTYVIEERVKAAQKGDPMYRQNVRVQVAASGTADECLGVSVPDDMETINRKAQHDYQSVDRGMMVGAVVLGAIILGLAFWPAILEWMTPFKYGVVAGALGASAVLIGALAIGVCLGAGRLEKAK